jgi:phage terminase large subunit
MATVELDYAPYDYQMDFHASTNRYSVIVGGRRVGKSRMALMELVKHCLETPGADAWWVAPTWSMSREVGFEEFRDIEDALAPAIVNVNATLMRIRFKNGSVLYFKGGDNEKSLRGRGLTYVVVDEAAFLSQDIWTRALLPALADRKGRALLISTPNGRNWFYDLANYANVENRLWSFRHWPSFLNPLITEDELTTIAASVSEMDFRQEFLAEFVTRAGMVYDEFSEANVIESFAPSLGDFDICLGVDFGFANPTAVAFLAVHQATGEVVMFDELYISRAKIDEIEQIIVAILAKHLLYPHDVKYMYTDPSGNATSQDLSDGISPVDYLRMSPARWRVVNKKSLIAPGLALVRSFIRASNGAHRFFITKNCSEGIRSLSGYAYDHKEGSTIKEEALKDGIHDHMCDAIRYFFVNHFNQSKWVAESPDNYMYGAEKQARVILKRCQSCRSQFPSRTPKTQPPYICKECER